MANNSEAYGDFWITGDWNREEVRSLLYVLRSLDGCNYYTHIPDLDDYVGANKLQENSIEAIDAFENVVSRLLDGHRIAFQGCGRWSMINNMESLWYWSSGSHATSNISGYVKADEYEKRRVDLIASMTSKDLTLDWSFKDAEGGCGFIYDERGHHKPDDKGELVYYSDHTEYYDYNLMNYCDVMYDGDEEFLGEAAWDIAEELGLDPRLWVDNVCKIIKQHPTWYNLIPYGSYDYLEDIPEELGKAIMSVVNKEVVYAN